MHDTWQGEKLTCTWVAFWVEVYNSGLCGLSTQIAGVCAERQDIGSWYCLGCDS